MLYKSKYKLQVKIKDLSKHIHGFEEDTKVGSVHYRPQILV